MSEPNQAPWFNKDAMMNSMLNENVTSSEILYRFKSAVNEVFDVFEKKIKEQEVQLEDMSRLRSELDTKQNKMEELAQKVQALQQVCQYKDERYQEKVREAARLHNICEMNAQSIIGSVAEAPLPEPTNVYTIAERLPQNDSLPRTRKKKMEFNTNPFIGVGYIGTQKRDGPTQFVKPHDKMSRPLPNPFTSLQDDGIILGDEDFEFQNQPYGVKRATGNHRTRDSVDSRLSNIGSVITKGYPIEGAAQVTSKIPFKPTSSTVTQRFDPSVLLVGQISKTSSNSRNAVIRHNNEVNEKQLRRLMTEPGPNSRRIIFERRRTKLWPHEDAFKRRA